MHRYLLYNIIEEKKEKRRYEKRIKEKKEEIHKTTFSLSLPLSLPFFFFFVLFSFVKPVHRKASISSIRPFKFHSHSINPSFTWRISPQSSKRKKENFRFPISKQTYNEIPSISRIITDISARFAASATRQKSCRKGAVAAGPPALCIWSG